MSWDSSWPQPTAEALNLIERVYRLANALRVMEINPSAAGIAMIISLREAFILLDHLKGPWQTAVWTSSTSEDVEPSISMFDLSVLPQPGLKWGLLFGVTLIVEESDSDDTP